MGFVRTIFVSRARRAPFHTLCALALLSATAGAAHDIVDDTIGNWRSAISTQNRSDGVAQSASDVPVQTGRTVSQLPTSSYGARRFSELYSVTWEDIPVAEATPADPDITAAISIANDGTIAGKQGDTLVLWHPDTRMWERVPKALAPTSVFISPDGSSVLASDGSRPPDPANIVTWNRASGWQTLAGSTATNSEAKGASRNFRFAVGGGINPGEPVQAWVWAIDGGAQHLLPTPDFANSAIASAVSDDGNIVIGYAVLAGDNDWPVFIAVRWVGGGPPTILRAPDGSELTGVIACNTDCSIVFGANNWFLKDNGEFGFLGTLPDANPDPHGTYYVQDASSDGSVVAGLYMQNADPANPTSETYNDRPYLWTSATGMTSLRSLATELGVGDEDWGSIDLVRLSPDGRRILIRGDRASRQPRTVVLHLTSRAVRLDSGHSTHARPTPPRTN